MAGRRVSETASYVPSDLAEMWNRLRSGQRTGHYYVALLGLRQYDTPSVVAAARRGLRFSALERFQRNTSLPLVVIASFAYIPERTLARRKIEGKLDPVESDRLLRLSRITARAIELFEGNVEASREWLTKPQRVLGGVAPLDMARTDAGSMEVTNVIGRLEHGIPT